MKRVPTIILPLEDYEKMVKVVRAIAAGACLNIDYGINLLKPQGDAREIWQTAFEVGQSLGGEDE